MYAQCIKPRHETELSALLTIRAFAWDKNDILRRARTLSLSTCSSGLATTESWDYAYACVTSEIIHTGFISYVFKMWE